MCRKLIFLTTVVFVASVVLMSQADAALPGLIGWWKLDEMTGTIANDSSGLENHGTLGPEGDPKWVLGHFGGALELDGSDDYVAIDAIADDLTENQLSFTAWIKTNQASGDGNVIGGNHGGGSHDFIWGVINGNMLVECDTLREYPPKIADNQWHHIAYTRDLNTAYVYTDGVQVGKETPSGNPSGEDRWSIGMEWDSAPSDEYNGIVDDVHCFNRLLTADEVVQVMIGIPPGAASEPSPEDGAIDVPREVVLSWTPGEFVPPTNGHKVYLSDIFNDVNDGIGGVTVSEASYAPPQRLELSTTYYWRVDEVNGAPDFTVHEGSVWSFTTELFTYPIETVTATASSEAASRSVENTINGSGLDETGLLHDKKGDDTMWLSNMAGPQPTWIQFEFDNVYKLHEMWVWNSNDSLEPMIGFGFKDVTIEYSSNGTDYTTLGTTHEFTRAPGTPDHAHDTTIDMEGVPAKYVRLTANSNWGGILNQYGLSEVRFFHVPVHAKAPSPDVGATDVPLDVTLAWNKGREAAKHDVYLSTDEQAVTDGTAAATTVTETSYGPLDLDLGKTYYWRVDEVNDAETPASWPGSLWNFVTQECFIVDDFEAYNDLDPTDPESNRIFNAWMDGYGVATNGSLVGYENPPFAEQSIVHSGDQSMPLFYDNSGTARYSEATLTLTSQRDWTRKAVETLVLWFKGNPAGFVEDPAGTYTMTAAGADIWGTSDQFRYAWKQLSGDGEISATVQSVLWVPGANDWSKAGVMIRESLDANSKNAFVALTSGAGNGATFQWRPSTGGSSSSDRTLTGISPPSAIRLVRQGNTFTGYVFQNGQWQQEGQSATVAMQSTVYIGLALTSHSSGITTEAVFSDVQTTGAVTGVFTEQAIGIDMPANTPDSMYVAVASTGGTPVEVRNDDPRAAQAGDWTEWAVDLKKFSDGGVNLTNVNTITIGFGDKAGSQPGGTGTVYFDDIRLYPAR